MPPSRPRRPRLTRWVLLSLLPAQGWQAVYGTNDGTHALTPVHALALAEERVRYADDGTRVPRDPTLPAEESRDIVGLTYELDTLWYICNDCSNFCGLIPPDVPLEVFLDEHVCAYRPATQEDDDAPTP